MQHFHPTTTTIQQTPIIQLVAETTVFEAISQPVVAAAKLRSPPIKSEELAVMEGLRAFSQYLSNNSATKKLSSFMKDNTTANHFQQQMVNQDKQQRKRLYSQQQQHKYTRRTCT